MTELADPIIERPMDDIDVEATGADEGAVAAITDVVRAVAGALGLDMSNVHIDATEAGGSRIRTQGLRGTAAGWNVTIDPQIAGDPVALRRVAAHETVHVAQQNLGGRPSNTLRAHLGAAEREADAIADMWIDGQVLPRPLATLAAGTQAADRGWAEQSHLASALVALMAVVEEAHPNEWQTLLEARTEAGTIDRRNVDLVVATLAGLPTAVASAMVAKLDSSMRQSLVGRLDDEHYDAFEPAVIAIFAALDRDELTHVDADKWNKLQLAGLTALDADLLLFALSKAPHRVVTELLARESDGDDIRGWHDLVTGATFQTENARSDVRSQLDQLVEDTAALATSDEDEHDGDIDHDAHAAALVEHVETAMDGEQWAEALLLIEDSTEEVRRIAVATLDEREHVERLLDKLDNETGEATLLVSPGAKALMGARSTAANIATARDRLSGGIFGWDWTEDIAVTEGDALVAFAAFEAIPAPTRESMLRSSDHRFWARDDPGDLLDRMERNLPEWFVLSSHYHSVAVDRNDDGRRVDRGTAAYDERVQALLRRILIALDNGSYGAAFEAIVSGWLAPSDEQSAADAELLRERIEMTQERRMVIVDRLDALDLMADILERMPPSIRRNRSRRLDLLEVAAVRSVPNLIRHMDVLVPPTSELADLAFVLFRALPVHERLRYSELGEIVEELSPEVTIWSGTNVLGAEATRAQRDEVRVRLADEQLWTWRRRGELRTYVGLAFALGDAATARRWAREPKFRVLSNPGLRRIVEDFRLDQDPRDPEDLLDVGRVPSSGFFSWLAWALGDLISGSLQLGDTGFVHSDMDLQRVGEIAGGTIGGAQFAPRQRADGDERERTISVDGNRAYVRYDIDGLLQVRLPQLALSGLGYQSPAYALAFGEVTIQDLSLDATFETSGPGHPRRLRMASGAIDAHDVLHTTASSTKAASLVHLDTLELNGKPSLDDTHTPGSEPRLVVYFMGISINAVLNALELVGGVKSGALSSGLQELRNIELHLGGATIEGALVGGVPVERVALGPTMVGWGGTRAAFLDQQQRLIERRLAGTALSGPVTAGDDRARLRAQLSAVTAELEAVRADDLELDRLMARSQRDPDSLTADDHNRIAELQHGPGGVVIDTGPIRFEGVGDLAERATIESLAGAVQAHVATGGRLTDQALATQFLRGGPPDTSVNQYSGSGRVDVGTIHVIGRPPSRADLEEWRQQAVAANGENRVVEIDMAIEVRRALDAQLQAQEDRLRSGQEPSSEIAGEIETLLRTLSAQVTIEGGFLEADTDTGRLEFEASRVHGTGVEADKFGARSFALEGVHADLGLDSDQLRALMERGEVPTPNLGLLHDLVDSGELTVRSGEIIGARIGAGDNEIGRIGFTGFSTGTITRLQGDGVRGFSIQGFNIDRLAGRGSDLRFGPHHIEGRGTVEAQGIHADLSIVLNDDDSVSSITIVDGRIDALYPVGTPDADADPEFHNAPLVYTHEGKNAIVNFSGGALRGLRFRNLVYDFATGIAPGPDDDPDSENERAVVTLDQIDAFELGASIAGYHVSTTLGSPATDNVAVSAALATDGEWSIDLLGISATDTAVTSPDGHVNIPRIDLANAGLRYDGTRLRLDRLSVPLVRVADLSWSVAGGTVTSSGPTEIRNIYIDQTATYNSERNSFHLPRLAIGGISSPSGLRYERGPLVVELRNIEVEDLAPTTAAGIELTNVTWRRGETTEFEVRVDALQADVDAGSSAMAGAALGDRDWGFIGNVAATGLSMQQFGDGRIQAGVEDLDASGQAHVAGLLDSDVDITDGSLGQIMFDGNTITVPPGAASQLRIGAIELGNFDLRSSTANVRTAAGETLRLENLGVGFTIEMETVGTPPGPTTTVLRSVRIPQVGLDRIATGGLEIDLLIGGTTYQFELSAGSSGPDSEIGGIRANDLVFELERVGGSYQVRDSSFRDVEIDRIDLHDVDFNLPLDQTLHDTVSTASSSGGLPPGYVDWVNALTPALDHLGGTVDIDMNIRVYPEGLREGAADFRRGAEQLGDDARRLGDRAGDSFRRGSEAAGDSAEQLGNDVEREADRAGRSAERSLDGAGRSAEGSLDRAGRSAERRADQVARAARRHGLGPVGDVAEGAGDLVRGGAEGVGDAVRGTAEGAGDVVRGTAEGAGDLAEGLGNQAERAADAVGQGGDVVLDESGRLAERAADGVGSAGEGAALWAGDFGDDIRAHIAITNGEVDVVDIESQILEELNIADGLLDFEVKGNTLVLEVDFSDVGIAGGAVAGGVLLGPGGAIVGGGLGGGAAYTFNINLLTWNLNPAEQIAAASDQVRVARLLIPTGGSLLGPTSGPSVIDIDFPNMVLRRLAAAFSIHNPAPIPITLPGSLGTVTLSANGLQDLALSASLATPRPAVGHGPVPANMDFSLGALNLDSANLNLSFGGTAVGTLSTGSVSLQDVTDGEVHVERLALPAAGTPGVGIHTNSVTGRAGTFAVSNLRLTP